MRKTIVMHGDIDDLQVDELADYFRLRAFHNLDRDGDPSFSALKSIGPVLIFTADSEKAPQYTKLLNSVGFPARTLNLRSAMVQMQVARTMSAYLRKRESKKLAGSAA